MVLQHAAHKIRGAARDTDLVARQGGDEFLVLLADLEVTSEDDEAEAVVAEVSERIARAIAEPADLPVGRVSVHASIGSALFPREAGDARTLLRLADEKMYARKRDRIAPSTEVRKLA
jgi:diguanylate cyclase (GGDEF)-like protein